MSTQHKYEQLEGFIVTEANIQCGICGSRGGEYGMDEYEAQEPLYKKGWRAKKEKAYCPKCAKKLLNKKKK